MMSLDVKNMIIDLMEKMRMATAPAKHIIIPISGGSDSALIYNLLNNICPHKIIGVHIGKNLREQQWFHSTGNLLMIDAEFSAFGPETAEAYRWATLLNTSLKYKGWLVGSRNRTEDELGTYSLASRTATYLPLVKVWKTDVMKMCEAIGIPQSIVDSSRKADPDCGRPIEMAEIPLELIDEYIKHHMAGPELPTSLSEDKQAYLENIMISNRFKSLLPIKH